MMPPSSRTPHHVLKGRGFFGTTHPSRSLDKLWMTGNAAEPTNAPADFHKWIISQNSEVIALTWTIS